MYRITRPTRDWELQLSCDLTPHGGRQSHQVLLRKIYVPCDWLTALEDVSDTSSSDDEETEVDEKALQAKILALKHKVQLNPYDYSAQVEYLSTLRSAGNLQEIRHAREKMSAVFPLTEELWLQWIGDEERLAEGADGEKRVLELYERAVADYLSVPIWVKYCKHVEASLEAQVEGKDQEAIGQIRALYERALSAGGIHYDQGAELWIAYRAFEQCLLDQAEEEAVDLDEGPDLPAVATAKSKIIGLFRRQLTVPHASLTETIGQMEHWANEQGREADLPVLQQLAVSTSLVCKDLQPLEDTLAQGGAAAYLSYAQYEQEHGDDPARVQCLYERGVASHALEASLWSAYITYMDAKLPGSAVLLLIHSKAVRNCPWVSALWQGYLRALEVAGKDHLVIEEVFQQALGAGFSQPDDYLQLWTAYIDYHRRAIDWSLDGEELQTAAEALRTTFQKAVDYMHHYFPGLGDPYCTLQQYWARVELVALKQVDRAREIWDTALKANGKNATLWLYYIEMEKYHGTADKIRTLYKKALHMCADWVESLGDAWVLWERENGTLQSWEAAIKRANQYRRQLQDRQNQAAAKEAVAREKIKADRVVRKQEKQEQRKQEKLKQHPEESRKRTAGSMGGEEEDRHVKRTRTTEPAKAKESRALPSTGTIGTGLEVEVVAPHNRPAENKDKTVFVSNLLYSVDEPQLQEVFQQAGKVQEVRLVRNLQGKSKGYAYVEFVDEASVAPALAMDRQLLGTRPMFINHHQEDTERKPRFPKQEDPKTLFVAELPKEYSQQQVDDLFRPYGAIKQVRLVTNKYGKHRGYCYVEFENEADAKEALVLDGRLVGDNNIKVAISNPPSRQSLDQAGTISRVEGDHGRLTSGPRGGHSFATTTSLMPRVLRPHTTQKPSLGSRVGGPLVALPSHTAPKKEDG
eukprot:Ihof_evm3s86 gene=Ihof_evmTU3s86